MSEPSIRTPLEPDASAHGDGRPETRGSPNLRPELVVALRTLVEDTDLPHREIAKQVRVSTATIWRLKREQGWSGPPGSARVLRRQGQPCRPKAVAAVRALVEDTRLTARAVADEGGMKRSTVGSLQTRRGWTRPRPARLPVRGQRGGGHPIASDVVAEARGMLEGSRLTFGEVSQLTGVSRTTLCRWCKRGRWNRPEPPGGLRPPRYFRYRRRGLPYAADAVGRVRDLVTGTLLSQKKIATTVGVSQERVSAWTRRRGWLRPSPLRSSKRCAASARTGPLATAGDRRGRPYAAATRREARALWELTLLSTALIGARLGPHPVTVARWAKEGGWERPRGRLGRAQLRGYFGMLARG